MTLIRQAPLAPSEPLSRALRVARTVLCAALPWLWVTRPDPIDRRRLAIGLGLCAAADGALVGLAAFVPGVLAFLVAQVVLLRRAADGLWSALRSDRATVGRTLVAVGLIWLGLLALLGPPLAARGLLVVVAAYGFVLLATVAAAALGHRIGTHPGPPGRRMVWGMICFALCDVLVGVGAALPDDPLARLARLHTGWFYTPALILLASSVRRPYSPAPRTTMRPRRRGPRPPRAATS